MQQPHPNQHRPLRQLRLRSTTSRQRGSTTRRHMDARPAGAAHHPPPAPRHAAAPQPHQRSARVHQHRPRVLRRYLRQRPHRGVLERRKLRQNAAHAAHPPAQPASEPPQRALAKRRDAMTSKRARAIANTPTTPPAAATGQTYESTSPEALRAHAAHIISRGLASGDLRHPAAPTGTLVIAGLQTAGHKNQEVVDALNATTTLLGEALIDAVLAELDAELVTKTDLQAVTHVATAAPTRTVTLQCPHGELLSVAVKPGTDTAHINCTSLRKSLKECPQ